MIYRASKQFKSESYNIDNYHKKDIDVSSYSRGFYDQKGIKTGNNDRQLGYYEKPGGK